MITYRLLRMGSSRISINNLIERGNSGLFIDNSEGVI